MAQTTLWVNADWATATTGDQIVYAGNTYTYGTDAFASVQSIFTDSTPNWNEAAIRIAENAAGHGENDEQKKRERIESFH